MRRNRTKWIVAGAGLLGAALAAAVPALALEAPPGRAWAFGAGLGFLQSLAGLHSYRRALLHNRADKALLWGLGSGLARILALLLALALAVQVGLPPGPTACSLLLMYFTMMLAEIHLVANVWPAEERAV